MVQNLARVDFTHIGVEVTDAERLGRPRVSYFKDAWRRFRENKIAPLALIILTIMVFFVIFGPAISGYDYARIDGSVRNQPPSREHWFGTDQLGRDLFARVWQGGRISMAIGLIGAFVASFIGSIYGGIAAYFGGIVDDIMMRIVEVLISVPYLIVVICFQSFCKAAALYADSGNDSRLVRYCPDREGTNAQVKAREYIAAAALGVGRGDHCPAHDP